MQGRGEEARKEGRVGRGRERRKRGGGDEEEGEKWGGGGGYEEEGRGGERRGEGEEEEEIYTLVSTDLMMTTFSMRTPKEPSS